jgi:hypothetical protein
MPRYFFHIQDSEEFTDTVGTDLADVSLVRRTATRTAAEMLRDDDRLWDGGLWLMRVTDEAGTIILTLEFRALIQS